MLRYGNILFAVLIIVAGVVIFFTIQSKITGGTPEIAGYKLYIVLSGSMEPALHTGSMALVQPINTNNLIINDIITFKGAADSDQLVTHRIVTVIPGALVSFATKGDANDVNDPQPVLASAVIGKVSKTIPYVGYAMSFARSRMGLLVLVIIPGTLIAALEMWKLFRCAVQLDREKQEKIRAELEKKAVAEGGEGSSKGL